MGANYANLFEVIAGSVSASDDETRISELCSELEVYLEPAQVEEIYQAYLVGAEAHEGQSRLSGEPYISHPVAVARILADMRMDSKSIIAAILHDVIEDTPTAKEHIAEQFGEEVAELVDGVSKLTQIDFRSKAEAQAENFRKMMLAMVKDIRVIIIKLADRLHNMRTLEVMHPDKRRRIAHETMDIYAPIANRLGIFKMRHELLDLSIKAAYPMRYRALDSACKEVVGYRKEIFNTIEAAIKQRLKETNIEATVKYRQKNIHSIYRKMKEKKLSFKELTDVFGVRIMTQSVDDCYRVLGVMHNLYKPLPGKFKDYLAIPKTNGYQSLHSSLFGPHGVAIEVQIRTEEMDHFAESGIAAHWIYKEGEASTTTAQSRALEWLKNLLEMQQMSGSSQEFLESVKVDLFPDEIYVFTPKGDIKKLPRGATVVDFAYAVHTDVGNTCVAARIDHHMSPLGSRLYNGQTIEIICSEASRPHPSWLDFVHTAKARTNIRHFLKSLQKAEAITLGQRLLQQSACYSSPSARSRGAMSPSPKPGSRKCSTSTTWRTRKSCSPKSVSATATRAWWQRPCTTSKMIRPLSILPASRWRSRAPRAWWCPSRSAADRCPETPLPVSCPPARALSSTSAAALTLQNAARKTGNCRCSGPNMSKASTSPICGYRWLTSEACWRRWLRPSPTCRPTSSTST
jgi:GTP pyrophosphokinase